MSESTIFAVREVRPAKNPPPTGAPLAGRKRGWRLGRKRGPLSDTKKAAISSGQIRRWADPRKRAIAMAALVPRHVDWTTEMDAELRALFATRPWRWLKTAGAKRIGVGDHTLRRRIRELGLKKDGWRKRRYPRPSSIEGSPLKNLDALYRDLGLSRQRRTAGASLDNATFLSP